jgi:hypothetical protein
VVGRTELSVAVIVVVTEVVGSVLMPFLPLVLLVLLNMNTVFFTRVKCFFIFITIDLMVNFT